MIIFGRDKGKTFSNTSKLEMLRKFLGEKILYNRVSCNLKDDFKTIIYDRTKNRAINNFQGLAQKMPLFTAMVCIAFFGSLGLPSLSGFIGEFFTLFGAFQSTLIPKLIPIFGVLGILLSAIYLLWTFQKMFFGNYWVKEEFNNQMIDLTQTELLLLGALGILSFVIGIFPSFIFDITNPTILNFFEAR